jgi:glycosyltransferase involved in cell wall biosynthesis
VKPAFNISVVIPTYNRAPVIERAIKSVLAQSRPPDEVIVVDDGSADGTRKIIEAKYGGLVKYVYQDNRGVSHARNVGIKLATGNWIALLDSDDEWKPEKLEFQLTALASQPNYDFCHTNEIWIRHGKRVNAMSKHKKSGGFIFEKCLPLCVISPSSALIKKTVFDEMGLFDEDLPACEDYDFWLRYCCVKPVLHIEQPLVIKYGGHEDQLSRKFLAMDRFRLLAIFKIISEGKLSESQEKAALNIFYEKHNILMSGANKHQNVELFTFCQNILTEMDALVSHRNISEMATQNQ